MPKSHTGELEEEKTIFFFVPNKQTEFFTLIKKNRDHQIRKK